MDRNESPKDKIRREAFRSHLHRALGRSSDVNNMSTHGSGHVFRGSAHPPETDKDGFMITRRVTSWSSHPGVAHSNARRNQTEDTQHHHVIVLHHDNATGHRMLSLAAPGHCDVGAHKEEELVSAPARYKLLKSEHVGNDEKTGKPIIKHTVQYHDSHPNWDASKYGELSEEEHVKAKSW